MSTKSSIAPPKEYKTERGKKIAATGISNRPYFSMMNAIEIKTIVDLMLAKPGHTEDRLLEYSENNLRPNSLYIKVCDGLKYLCQYLDSEGKYKEFRSAIKIARESKGVTIRWIKTRYTTSVEENQKAIAAVEAFIEDGIKDKLHLTGLDLEPEHIIRINTFLQPVSELYAFKATKTEILIVKK